MEVRIDFEYQNHIERYVDMDVKYRDRYLFLTIKYVENIYNHLMKGKYQLDKKDEMNVNL
jgi:hypothetical protein